VLSCQGDSPVRFLRHMLVSVQSVLRRRAAVRSAVWASAAALAALILVLTVDAVWVYPRSSRPAVYLMAALAGAAGVAISMLLAWARKPSLFYVARLIERGRPELKNDLMTFLDLSADSGADPSAAVAIARRSARLLVKFEPTRLLPPHRLRRPCAAVAGAAVALAVGVWLAQGVLFQPWIGQAEAGLVSGNTVSAALGGPGTAAVEAPGAVAARPEEAAASLAPSPEPKRDGEQSRRAGTAQQKEASAPGSEQAVQGALAENIAAEAGTLERLAAALEALASSPSSAPPSSADQGPAGAGQGAGRDSSQESQQGGGSEPAGSEGPTPLASAGAAGAGSEGNRDGTAGGGTERTETASATGSTTGTGTGTGTGTSHQAASTGGAESQGDAAGGPAGTGAGARQDNQGQGGAGGRTSGPGRPPRRLARPTGPPIPERPQPTAFPKNPLDATRWTDRLIKEADRRLREGEVSDAFLDRMGMSQAEFRRFVVAWQRRLESAARGPGATQAPGAVRTAAPPGAGEAVEASGAGLASTMVDRGPDGTSGPSNLVQDDSFQVSVRFRPVVSAYFDELSRLAEKPKEP